MFKNKSVKYSKMLDLDPGDYEEFIKRYLYFLKGQDNLTKASLENGLFILLEIKNRKIELENEKIKYHTKNHIILKYREEIISLYHSGLGAIRIAKSINSNHNIPKAERLTKGKVRHFLDNNGIVRNG